MLPYIQGDIATTIAVTRLIADYLETTDTVILPIKVESIVLQNVLQWLHSEHLDIRWNATRILIAMSHNPENQGVVNRQLVNLIDSDPIVTEICPADPLAQLGYRAEDLDGDGTPELVIGTMAGDDFSGKMIVSLYTLPADGAPQLLFDSTAQSCYYYAGSARFANLGSSDLGGSFVTTVRLEEGEMIDMTYTTDPADYIQLELTPFSQWNA